MSSNQPIGFETYKITKQGQYRCPKCLTLYRPIAGYKYKAGPDAKPFVPASQCLVVRYTPETPLAPDSWAQKLATYDNSNDQFYLYLCELPEQNESVLLNNLKKVCQQLAQDIEDTSDPLQALHQRIKTELDKAQKVPYFKKFPWDPSNLATVKAWNNQGRTRPWRLDRLPREATDETPFFEGCPYQYEESTTKILSTQDLMMIFCRVHLHHEARAQFFSAAQGHNTSHTVTGST